MTGRWQDGFTLVEVLVAAALLMTVWLAAARLFMSSSAANAGARGATLATVLAVEKLEQLRALAVDDPALALSPPDAIAIDVDGYHDAPVAQYVRRWSIEPLPSYPGSGVVIAVLVTRTTGRGEAYLTTVKTRKPE